MTDFQVDLSNCDREPIHIPGQIQSHGFLLVLDNENIIRFCSENTSDYLGGISVDLLDQPLSYFESIIGNVQQTDFITQLIKFGKASHNFEQINPFQFNIAEIAFHLVISTAKEYCLLEFEPTISTVELNIQKMIGRSISKMLGDRDLGNLLNNSVVQIKNITHYDRVMIYRFAEDQHGEVVAESKNEDLDPWLGLHYPASDIPNQARALYKLNMTRLIADVQAIPSKIITSYKAGQTLDLTHAQLRAVSPIHIQYLKNMGVCSSFSISLLYKGELWGLIACHNYSPLFIDYKSRESAKLIGQILSSALEFRQDEENQSIYDSFNNTIEKLSKLLQESETVESALTHKAANLLEVVHAGGVVLTYEKKVTKLGATPNDAQIQYLINWLKKNNKKSVYHTANLSSIYPEAFAYRDVASGILVCTLDRELKEYIIWFKPEQIQTIKWAGNPEKTIEVDEDGLMQISPRNSFSVWSETVAGNSANWLMEEVSAVKRLKEEIVYAVNIKARSTRLLNEKLKQAYEELDTFGYTISHDLKTPLATIKLYAQILAKDQSNEQNRRNLLIRIGDGADKMNQMINEVLDYSRIGRSELNYSKIDVGVLIGDIVDDINVLYQSNTLKITIGETPELYGEPMMLMQLFSNLISNAVKYSRYSEIISVHINGVVNELDICYSIRDNGIGINAKDLPKIFDLFKRLDNVKDIEGSGVGLSIVKRIVERHKGKIWAESELGVGSVFYVAFNKHQFPSIASLQ